MSKDFVFDEKNLKKEGGGLSIIFNFLFFFLFCLPQKAFKKTLFHLLLF